MKQPYLIASYPRSGSTWLRFILCHLYYAGPHDFSTVNHFIPDLDDFKSTFRCPLFFKTHSLRNSSRIIFLHRHVGDVLISEYHYKRKFHGESRSLESFFEAVDYGQGWREHIRHYFPSRLAISYDSLDSVEEIGNLLAEANLGNQLLDASEAINRSSFAEMQKAESKGLGCYPSGDESIKFVRKGITGQWRDLDLRVQMKIIDLNSTELRWLGYL